MNIYEEVVEEIIKDLSERSGLGDAWLGLPELYRTQIRNEWKHIVAVQISKHENEIKSEFGAPPPNI